MDRRVRFEITAENGDFLRSVGEVRGALRKTVSDVRESGNTLDNIFGRMESGLKRVSLVAAGAFTVARAAQFAKECVGVRSEVQALETSFATLLNSEEKSAKMLGGIKEFAATTPMDMDVLAKGAQTMLGFNIEAEKVLPMLRAIGDISMGDAGKFESLSLSFSQMSATGKLMGQDLLQMINAGFNPLAQISEKTGKSIGELKEEMEKGKITVEMVTQAFIDATSEGGKFHGMLSKQAEGLKGAFAYLRGSVSQLMNDIGEMAEGPVADTVNLAGDVVKSYREIGETIGVLVGMYGAYKAAVVVNAAVELGEIGRATALTLAKNRLTAAVTRLNVALAANPYGLAAAAVVALAYGTYRLATYQTEAEKSQKRLNESYERGESAARSEQIQIAAMFRRLREAKEGTEAWEKARNAIWSKYGVYLKNLGDEQTALKDVAAAYTLVAREATKAAKARALDSYLEEESGNYQKKYDKNYDAIYKEIADKMGTDYADSLREDISRVLAGEAKWTKSFLSKFNREVTSVGMAAPGSNKNPVTKYTVNSLEDLTASAKSDDKDYRKRIERAYKKWDVDGLPSKSDEDDGEKVVKNKKYWEKKKEDAQTALDALSDIEAAGAEGEKLRNQIREYDKKVTDLYSAKEKKSTGPTADQVASKEENAAGKLADIIRKQAEERLRIEQDYEYERWQTRINLMEEGSAKIEAQQKLDFAKEKTNLNRRLSSELESELQRQMAVFNAEQEQLAAANKKYAKKVFRDSDIDQSKMDEIANRYKALEDDLGKTQDKAINDRLKASKEAYNNYLKEFGSYEQKRKAIDEEYSKRIAEAPNSGERKIAIANRNKEYADLDFEEWQEGGGMALAFGDISKLSKETVGQLIADMEKYRGKIIATFDPDKIQKFDDALNNLRRADIDFDFDFGGNELLEPMRERLALQKQIADAEANEAELLNQKKQMEEELNSLTMKMMTPSLDTAAQTPDGEKPESEVIQEDVVKRAEELRVMLDSVSKSLLASSNNSRQLQSQLKDVGKIKFSDIRKFSSQIQDTAKKAGDLASVFNDEIGDAIGGAADKIEVMVDSFETVKSSIEALKELSKKTAQDAIGGIGKMVDGVSTGVQASSTTAANSISTLEKASAILAIIGAAIQLATMVASLVNPDKKHEKEIERLQDQIDALEKSYDKLGRAADDAFSTDASRLVDQQNTLLQQQKVLIKQQMAEEEAKKKTDDDKIKEYQDRLEEIDETLSDNKKKAKEAIIGEDIKSAIDEFASLYAGAWDDGTDAAQESMQAVKSIISSALNELLKKNIQPAATAFYDELAKAMEKGYLTNADLSRLDAIKAHIDALAASSEEQYKKIQERYKDLDELREELTDISFDSVSDNFKSLLSDMEATTEDFTDNFTDMIRNALIEGLMNNKYDAMLKEWYEEFAEAMNDQALSDSERDALRQKYDSIVQQGIADRNAINDIVGGGSYSQSASSGGWETMGQDQADELNGRFTALTELEAINNNLVSDGNAIAREILIAIQSLKGISAMTDSGDNSTLLAIKDMMFLSTGYLEDIAKYAKWLTTISGGIDDLKNLIDKRL